MKRFFGKKDNDKIVIDGSEFNHLKKVLRMVEGDKVIASINDENDYYCTIEKMDKNNCQLKIDKVVPCPALPKKILCFFKCCQKKNILTT